MHSNNQQSIHSFHIPVMGIAYTIDTPIKVARFGISSTISIVEDRLIELMRKHYYPSLHKTYVPISTHEPDYRAKRITDYLNLVQEMVNQQMETLRNEAFEIGNDIIQYFDMLPNRSPLKKIYQQMLSTEDLALKQEQQQYLRSQIVPGQIDVNIMTKVDRDHKDGQGEIIPHGSDAVAALRGYAQSQLRNSSIIFSAGLNPRLYNYLETLNDFNPDESLQFNKKVVVKVSDYRSALIQGKYLAKKGIWVSEFRIESGLNCGGHAFATDGFLLGPILDEFKTKRLELQQSMFDIYKGTIEKKVPFAITEPPAMNITVQGGIGTYEEDRMLHEYFDVSSTGWGTPFLLVPEATTVDAHTLGLLQNAKEQDVVLSRNSPLGVRFHYLLGTTSDTEKHQRIALNKPGSPCTEKHLAFNTEFTEEPICTASHQYQKLKLKQLKSQPLSPAEYVKQAEEVLDKECLCIGLSNAAALEYDEVFLKNFKAVNICPGPNIANFSQVVSLSTMIDHIYGRTNLIDNSHRPHMFIAELIIYVNFLNEQIREANPEDLKRKTYLSSFANNLLEGIDYYQNFPEEYIKDYPAFMKALQAIEKELHSLKLEDLVTVA